jgi:arsenite/tail-anchored protein-transporting ATPase
MSVSAFLHNPPRYLFFTGKGGVGKTSIACATALEFVDAGKRVLLVSTDPASNIGQVFGQVVGNRMVPIAAVPGLIALEIDPEEAVSQYRERVVGPLRGVLPEAEIRAVTESLSGSCTTEIASFNEFTGLLTDDALADRFDHILFDTAPTGHTIRLLRLPGSWNDYLQRGKGDAICLGPMAGLDRQKAVYAEAVEALANPELTRLVLVARPQGSALAEVGRTHEELADIGLTQQYVVVNGVMPESESSDPLAVAIRTREQAALADIPDNIADLPLDIIPLKSRDMVGADALRTLFVTEHLPEEAMPLSLDDLEMPPLAELVDGLTMADHGLVMLMGKGGVGKTTMAAAIAVALARAGKHVHLTTTDPAAHLTDTLQGTVEGLTISRIDPQIELRNYQERVMRTKGARLDEEERALLAEDLRSPCYQEVAVFEAFSKAVRQSRGQFVVIDTAPTGHTLLLMDTTGAYHREIARQMTEGSSFQTPLMQLQDPDATKVIITTLAETTPVLEAEELHQDLARAEITPWAWIINNSLLAAHTTSSLLQRRAASERPQVARVANELSRRYAVVPLLRDEPVGVQALEALVQGEPVAR